MSRIKKILSSSRLFSKGSKNLDGGVVDDTTFNRMTASFESNKHLVDDVQFEYSAPLIFQMNELKDDVDNLHTHLSESLYTNRETSFGGSILVSSHITASGNISSSGTLLGNSLTLGGTAITSTGTELNIVDGGTVASNITPQDADRVVYNDGGVMRQVTITKLASYFDDEITNMPNLADIGTDLTVAGNITATSLNVTSITSSIVTSSILQTEGSNIFGDTIADTHTFNGGIIAGNITASGNISASGTLHTFGGRLNIKSAANNTTAFNISDIDGQNNLNFAIDANQHSDFHIERDGVDKIRLNSYWPAEIDNDSYETFGGLILGSDVSRENKSGFGLYVSAGPDSGSIYTKERVFIGVGGATGSNDMLSVGGNITTTSHITASGNISASGTIVSTGTISNIGSLYQAQLDNGTTAGPRFNLGSAADSDLFLSIQASGGINKLDSKGRDFHLFSTAATTGFYFDEDNANIGIQTTTPTKALQVTGDISASGDLHLTDLHITDITASGNISSSGTITANDVFAGAGTFSGNINANGSIVGDDSTNITGIADIDASAGTVTAGRVNTTGGVHVGGTSDPGTDNLIVDGTISASKTDAEHTLGGKLVLGDRLQSDNIYERTTGVGITLHNHITASGDISASGALKGSSLDINGGGSVSGDLVIGRYLSHDGDSDTQIAFETNTISFKAGNTTHMGFTQTGGTQILTNITASGDISSSGTIDAERLHSGGTGAAFFNGTAMRFSGNTNTTEIYGSQITNKTDTLVDGHITASGDISASGTIKGGIYHSFGNILGTYHGGSDSIKLANSTDKTELRGTNITISGPVTASGDISSSGVGTFNSLDIAGAIDVDGTSNLDTIDVDGPATFASRTVFEPATFSLNDTTQDVRLGRVFLTNANTTTKIDTFDNGTAGQIIHIIHMDNNTDYTNGTNLKLRRGFDHTSGQTDDTITFVCVDGTKWVEQGRSDNT